MKIPLGLFTRANIAIFLMLGGAMIMTLGVAVTIYLLAYQTMPGPESAAVARISGIAQIGLVCTFFSGAAEIVLGVIVLNIDRLSVTAGMVTVNMDRVDEIPPLVATTTTTTVTTPPSTEGAA